MFLSEEATLQNIRCLGWPKPSRPFKRPKCLGLATRFLFNSGLRYHTDIRVCQTSNNSLLSLFGSLQVPRGSAKKQPFNFLRRDHLYKS